jgi:hypothetical protein
LLAAANYRLDVWAELRSMLCIGCVHPPPPLNTLAQTMHPSFYQLFCAVMLCTFHICWQICVVLCQVVQVLPANRCQLLCWRQQFATAASVIGSIPGKSIIRALLSGIIHVLICQR